MLSLNRLLKLKCKYAEVEANRLRYKPECVKCMPPSLSLGEGNWWSGLSTIGEQQVSRSTPPASAQLLPPLAKSTLKVSFNI
jgi:hypothetical protein